MFSFTNLQMKINIFFHNTYKHMAAYHNVLSRICDFITNMFHIPFFMFSFFIITIADITKYYLYSSLCQTTVVTRPEVHKKARISEIHLFYYIDKLYFNSFLCKFMDFILYILRHYFEKESIAISRLPKGLVA